MKNALFRFSKLKSEGLGEVLASLYEQHQTLFRLEEDKEKGEEKKEAESK